MIALTIAGFDPSGGAGILRDISVFSSLNLSFRAVPTALTIQTREEVFGKEPIPTEYIRKALGRLQGKIHGVKIGMLSSEEVVKLVVDFLTIRKPDYVVLDPVIRSSSGYPLISKEGLKELKGSLIAYSTFITPNLEEGRILTSEEEPDEISKKLHSLGARYVVVTGVGGRDDYFYDGEKSSILKGSPIDFSFHGSGCFYSSYLLGRLLLGDSPLLAAKNAKKAVEDSEFF